MSALYSSPYVASWLGAWSSTTAYVPGNGVSYNGFVYACAVANTGNVPSTSSNYWVQKCKWLPGVISTGLPNMDGTASAGSTGLVSDAGHIHPSDTSRQAASSVLTEIASVTPVSGYLNYNGSAFSYQTPSGSGGSSGLPGIAPYVEPVLSNFTWFNQGSAVAVQQGAAIAITCPIDSSGTWRMLLQAVPSVPYTATLLINSPWLTINYMGAALCLYYSTGSELIAFQKSTNTTYGNLLQYVHGGTAVTYTSTQGMDMLWLRMQDNGTNRIASISIDGYNFIPYYTESRTNYITPNYIGFGIQPNSSTYPTTALIQSWSVTTP